VTNSLGFHLGVRLGFDVDSVFLFLGFNSFIFFLLSMLTSGVMSDLDRFRFQGLGFCILETNLVSHLGNPPTSQNA